MNDFKKWIIGVFIGIFITSSIIVVFNYSVDSFNLFEKSNANISKDLNDGYYVTGNNISSNRVDNIYESMIEAIKEVDVIAIGSSRTMLLHKDLLFNDDKIIYYNFTDGTAYLKHYAKIIGLFNKHNIPFPHNIILGIDPWVFDQKASLSQIKRLINNTNNDSSEYLQLFNFEYTTINLKSLFNKKEYQKSKNLNDLLTIKNNNIIISPNGDLYNPLSVSIVDTNRLIKSVKEDLKKCDESNYDTKCIKYSKLNNFNELNYLIDYLKNKDVNVIVYFSPFEPTFFEHIVKYNKFSIYNKQIRRFFVENNINTIGSYNPSDYNLTSNYFLDGIHPVDSAIKIIF